MSLAWNNPIVSEWKMFSSSFPHSFFLSLSFCLSIPHPALGNKTLSLSLSSFSSLILHPSLASLCKETTFHPPSLVQYKQWEERESFIMIERWLCRKRTRLWFGTSLSLSESLSTSLYSLSSVPLTFHILNIVLPQHHPENNTHNYSTFPPLTPLISLSLSLLSFLSLSLSLCIRKSLSFCESVLVMTMMIVWKDFQGRGEIKSSDP